MTLQSLGLVTFHFASALQFDAVRGCLTRPSDHYGYWCHHYFHNCDPSLFHTLRTLYFMALWIRSPAPCPLGGPSHEGGGFFWHCRLGNNYVRRAG